MEKVRTRTTEKTVSHSAPGAAAQNARSVQEHHQPPRNLDWIMQIPLEITVEFGRAQQKIQEILGLHPGSVLNLSQLEGDPVDLLVNGTLIAKGEVVVDRGKYGIRIVEIVNRKERMKGFW